MLSLLSSCSFYQTGAGAVPLDVYRVGQIAHHPLVPRLRAEAFHRLLEGMAYASSTRELNDAELDAVAGGGSWCYVIGGSEGADTWACTTWDNGAGACGYIGIGFMWNDYD